MALYTCQIPTWMPTVREKTRGKSTQNPTRISNPNPLISLSEPSTAAAWFIQAIQTALQGNSQPFGGSLEAPTLPRSSAPATATRPDEPGEPINPARAAGTSGQIDQSFTPTGTGGG